MADRLLVSSAVALTIGLPGAAFASTALPYSFTLPNDLAPGSSYELVFVTSNVTGATSSDIATDNSFVTTDAALNPLLPTTIWKAVGSTTTTAFSNVCGTACANVPVYLVNGTRAADSVSALFNSSLLVPIGTTESGRPETATDVSGLSYVWTGSNSDGSAGQPQTFGSASYHTPLGYVGQFNNQPSRIGISATTTSYALQGDYTSTGGASLDDGYFDPTTATLPMYAVSGLLRVPGAVVVPEPMSAALLGLGGLGTALVRRRRARR